MACFRFTLRSYYFLLLIVCIIETFICIFETKYTFDLQFSKKSRFHSLFSYILFRNTDKWKPKFKIEVQILDEGRRMFRGGEASRSVAERVSTPFCVITKRRDEKCHRQFNWRTSFHHHARAQAQHRKPWQVCMGNRPEECRIPQAQAAGKPHSGQGTATGGGESAEKGAMVSRADIRPSQAPGQAHIP